MRKIVRLIESDLNRLIRRVINENEIDRIKQSDDFLKLVDILQSNPRAADKLRDELFETINEDNDEYDYYDYIDSQPKEINKDQYWKRRLKGLGLGAAVGALMGVAMAGGFSAEDVLQMALASATGVGAVSDTLMRTVGRTKKIDNIEEKFLKKNTRLSEIDVNRLIKKIITEQESDEEAKRKTEDLISKLNSGFCKPWYSSGYQFKIKCNDKTRYEINRVS